LSHLLFDSHVPLLSSYLASSWSCIGNGFDCFVEGSNLILYKFQASSKHPGSPGLVFDEFDQLYTNIIFTELLDQDEEYEFKFPYPKKELEKIQSDLADPDNQTFALIEYINDIDYRTIVTIQKLTADLIGHENEARKQIQKYSHVFRREGCMKEVKDGYRAALTKKATEFSSSACPDRVQQVQFNQLFYGFFKFVVFFSEIAKL
jgi:hypothetical protein